MIHRVAMRRDELSKPVQFGIPAILSFIYLPPSDISILSSRTRESFVIACRSALYAGDSENTFS